MNSLPWGLTVHMENGSPWYPSRHEHIGVWLTTLHRALVPQDPRQGFWHLVLIQALSLLQSVFLTHSDLQYGGLPMKPDKQEHDGTPPISRHWEFGPHGDGRHGLTGSLSTGVDSVKEVLVLVHIYWNTFKYLCTCLVDTFWTWIVFTYLADCSSETADRQCILACRCKLGYALLLDSPYWCHRTQGKQIRIWDFHTLYPTGIQSW